ncbi:hypothetical protein Y1Q_0020572 [Alligator mississippiensis]|uniref:Uncharacterized protein n=1 Tax=Alligator mississippiensis TaxID=8496 RepID=A0A151PJ65_ALLMI|nr:hypothetical protein Y1Q_0020572 [Alligator mississippiensis]
MPADYLHWQTSPAIPLLWDTSQHTSHLPDAEGWNRSPLKEQETSVSTQVRVRVSGISNLVSPVFAGSPFRSARFPLSWSWWKEGDSHTVSSSAHDALERYQQLETGGCVFFLRSEPGLPGISPAHFAFLHTPEISEKQKKVG